MQKYIFPICIIVLLLPIFFFVAKELKTDLPEQNISLTQPRKLYSVLIANMEAPVQYGSIEYTSAIEYEVWKFNNQVDEEDFWKSADANMNLVGWYYFKHILPDNKKLIYNIHIVSELELYFCTNANDGCMIFDLLTNKFQKIQPIEERK